MQEHVIRKSLHAQRDMSYYDVLAKDPTYVGDDFDIHRYIDYIAQNNLYHALLQNHASVGSQKLRAVIAIASQFLTEPQITKMFTLKNASKVIPVAPTEDPAIASQDLEMTPIANASIATYMERISNIGSTIDVE